jgi:hypothetical protein
MKSSVKTPASLRYMKARLRPFSRPAFWGSLCLICVWGFAIYQYFQHPEWLSPSSADVKNTTPTFSQLSSEDLAVGADLDNVDLLLKELEQQETIPLTSSNKISKKNPLPTNNQDTAFSRFKEQQKAKLNRSPAGLSPSSVYSNNLPSNNLSSNRLLNPSSFNSISSLTNFQSSGKNYSNSENIIPNPVGRLYLTDRNQNFNLNQTNLTAPANIPANLNSDDSLPTNNLAIPETSDNIVESSNYSNYASPQIIQPQINYSTNSTVTTNNSASSNTLSTTNTSNNNVINYQLPSVNYSNIQTSSDRVQSQGIGQINQTNVNTQTNNLSPDRNNFNPQNNSTWQSTGSLQPSALNQPNF